MDPKLKSTIWEDERVEKLTHVQFRAFMWLLSNSTRDLCGITRISDKHFTRYSGLPITSLQGACKVLGASIQTPLPGTYFLTNFLRHQFGAGGEISPKNLVVKGAIKRARTYPEALRRAFFEAYPEFPPDPLGYTSGEDAAASPLEGEEKRRTEQSITENSSYSSPDPWPQRLFEAYPRQSHHRDSITAITACIIRQKGNHTPEAILAGTKAIAEVVAKWPASERNKFVPTAVKFFEADRWLDDPATWNSRQAELLEAAKGDRPALGRPTRGGLRILPGGKTEEIPPEHAAK